MATDIVNDPEELTERVVYALELCSGFGCFAASGDTERLRQRLAQLQASAASSAAAAPAAASAAGASAVNGSCAALTSARSSSMSSSNSSSNSTRSIQSLPTIPKKKKQRTYELPEMCAAMMWETDNVNVIEAAELLQNMDRLELQDACREASLKTSGSDDELRIRLIPTPLGRWHRWMYDDEGDVHMTPADWAAIWNNPPEALEILTGMSFLGGACSEMETAPESVRSDWDFMLEACKATTGAALEYASPDLLNRKEFFTEAVVDQDKSYDGKSLKDLMEDGVAEEVIGAVSTIVRAAVRNGDHRSAAAVNELRALKVKHKAAKREAVVRREEAERAVTALEAAEQRTLTAENALVDLRRQLAQQRCALCAPETIDLSSSDDAAAAAAQPTKRKASAVVGMVHATQKRLTVVKEEKREALLDLEDQEETTTQVAVTLDRWQSYADVLKKQLVATGKQPLRWSTTGAFT